MQSNLIRLHLTLPRRYTALMSPQQADPGLAEAGAVGAGAGLAGAVKAGADEAGARLAGAVQAGADEPGGVAPLVSAWRSPAACPGSVRAPLPHQLRQRHAPSLTQAGG